MDDVGWLRRVLDAARRSAERRPVVAKLVGNASWLLAERIAVLAFAFVFNAWMARHLGPSDFGRYAYALSFVGLFSALAGLGMDSIVVRELALHPNREGEILGTAMALRATAGTAAWLGASLLVLWVRPDAGTRVAVAVVAISALAAGVNVFELWFQARIAARGMVVTRTAVTVLAHVARGALILLGAGFVQFAALFSVTGIATTLSLWWLFRRVGGRSSRLTWSRALATTLIRDSWPMALVAAGVAVYMKIDQVMLSAIAGDAATGTYAPAVALSEVWYFIPTAVSSSVFPVIVKSLAERSSGDLNLRLQDFYDWMAGLAYAIGVPVWLVADPLVSLLYGQAYAETSSILRIHIGSLVFVALGIARGRYLIATNQVGFILFATFFGAALNVALNLLLMPQHGARGAAWATLLSYAGANYVSGMLWAPVWQQTAMLTKAIFVPVRALVGLPAALRRL